MQRERHDELPAPAHEEILGLRPLVPLQNNGPADRRQNSDHFIVRDDGVDEQSQQQGFGEEVVEHATRGSGHDRDDVLTIGHRQKPREPFVSLENGGHRGNQRLMRDIVEIETGPKLHDEPGGHGREGVGVERLHEMLKVSGVAGLEADGPGEGRERLVEFAALGLGGAQARVRGAIRGPVGGGAPQDVRRFRKAVPGQAENSDAGVGVGEGGIEVERPVVGGDRLVDLSPCAQGLAEIVMECRVLRLDLQSTRDPVRCRRVSTRPMIDQAQEVQGIGVVGFRRDELFAEVLCGFMISRLILTGSLGESFRCARQPVRSLRAAGRPRYSKRRGARPVAPTEAGTTIRGLVKVTRGKRGM